MSLFKVWTFIFIAIFLVSTTRTFAEVTKAPAKEKPLVLQMQVSHLRNTDQVSLIFKGKRLLLVTNVHQFSVKPTKTVRLGEFQTRITSRWRLLKRQIQAYKRLLDKDNPGGASESSRAMASIPHAYQVKIGGDGRFRTISKEHPYFAPLKSILMEAIQNQKRYRCISCAAYYKKKKSIIRVVKKHGKSPQRKKFSKEQLQCRPIGKKLECVDKDYGLFEI